jgi:hypothetical protein
MQITKPNVQSVLTLEHTAGKPLRVLKRLGFTPPFVRRASYFRASLSEDCYAPSRVLQKVHVLSFGYSGLSFGRYLEPGSFQCEFTLI